MSQLVPIMCFLWCVMLAPPTKAQSTRWLKRELNKLRVEMTRDLSSLQLQMMDLREEVNSTTGGTGGASNNAGYDPTEILKLKTKSKEQDKTIIKLSTKLGLLQKESTALEDTVDKLSQNCSSEYVITATNVANLRTDIANFSTTLQQLSTNQSKYEGSNFREFTTMMRTAFKNHKQEVLTSINDLDATLQRQNQSIAKTNDTGIRQEFEQQMEALKIQIAKLTAKIENIKVVSESADYGDGGLLGGGAGEGGGGGILGGGVLAPTTAATVTLTPGGPRIMNVFGEDLRKAIKIGSRVVRGKDWAWGKQDGDGPGTVTGWYRGMQESKQVMVKWDKARRANYRVGAHGKYDLYLLAE